MSKKRCIHCRCYIDHQPPIPNQRYCPNKTCQRARKNRWKKRKLKCDPDYRANQQSAQRQWQEQHKEYWKQYKADHPEYVKHNREQCKNRAKRKRQQSNPKAGLGISDLFVKSDALKGLKEEETKGYKLILVPEIEFVKIDASLTKTIYISTD
jgi:hypothetical protein